MKLLPPILFQIQVFWNSTTKVLQVTIYSLFEFLPWKLLNPWKLFKKQTSSYQTFCCLKEKRGTGFSFIRRTKLITIETEINLIGMSCNDRMKIFVLNPSQEIMDLIWGLKLWRNTRLATNKPPCFKNVSNWKIYAKTRRFMYSYKFFHPIRISY